MWTAVELNLLKTKLFVKNTIKVNSLEIEGKTCSDVDC